MKGKILKITLVVLAMSFLLFSVLFVFEFHSTPKMTPENILFTVNPGEAARSIAQNLKEKGIIKKDWLFLLGYRLFYSGKSMKAGEYEFHLPVSTKDALNKIIEGKIYLHPITIPEGLTRMEIARHLSSSNFANEENFLNASSQTEIISGLDKEASDLEGYLFPETYSFPKGASAEIISKAFVSQFKEVFTATWRKRAAELKMTVREVVILASLIEKETSMPEERKLVSAVFHNRLNIRMKLDCDPTIIYALKKEGRFKTRLLIRDLKFKSPYNTYLHRGLPPGPICNPGRGSLQAALYPADEKFLYFVSKNDGSHHFSRTFKEHQRAVIKYRKQR